MKVLFIILIVLSCSRNTVPKINYKSKKIFDLETKPENIIYLCTTPGNKKEPRTFFTVHVLGVDRSDCFYTRRALELKECKTWLQEVEAIMKGASIVRVVGLEGSEDEVFKDEDLSFKTSNDYSTVKSLWLFSRIVTDKGCVGYFGKECEPGFDEKSLYINP